jgi:preprotein translocase subunit SecG
MLAFAKVLHITACIAMIVIVLLQADKGEGLSGAFGSGGTGAIFGKRGATGFFARVTAGAAIIFMLTSFWLGLRSTTGRAAPKTTVPIDTSGFPVQ